MHFVTHLDTVRAAIRSAWPSGIVCPPLVVRFRAGSDPAGWDTLIELARIRRHHPDDLVVDRLTRAVSVDLVSNSETLEAAETAEHLIAGTLRIVAREGQRERTPSTPLSDPPGRDGAPSRPSMRHARQPVI